MAVIIIDPTGRRAKAVADVVLADRPHIVPSVATIAPAYHLVITSWKIIFLL